MLIAATLGAMLLAHRERFGRRYSQRDLAEDRVLRGVDITPLPSPGVFARNNAVDDVARAILPLAHATLERIRAEELRTEVVGVDYDALCDAVKQLEATYRAGWWRAAEREGADFFLREVEALERLNVPPVRANWRDAGKIVGILRKMPNSTLRRVAPTTNPMALRFMVGRPKAASMASGGNMGKSMASSD